MKTSFPPLLAVFAAFILALIFPACLFAAPLSPPGTVVAWGDNRSGQTSVPAGLGNVVQIAAGGYHSLALKSDGTVVAWGGYDVPAGLNNAVQIAAGTFHSLALKGDGTVVVWGDNSFGQYSVPAGLSNVVQISAGHIHNLALQADGTVVAWGNNSDGQSNVPAGIGNIAQISAGSGHNLALKNDGTVVAWGLNTSGQSSVPAGLSNVVQIAAGGYHSLALKSDGTVVVWGRNDVGQSSVPAGLGNVVQIAAGDSHSLALKSDGTVVAWGLNIFGESNVPVGLRNVMQIAAGYNHSLAITASLSDGLVAYYPFNGNANDASGNANNGTVVDAVLTTDRFGIPNSAYDFNGNSSRIVVPDSASLRLTGDFSIAAWIKPRSLLFSDIVTKHSAGGDPDGGWAFRLDPVPDFEATPYFDPQVNSGQSVTANLWQHLLFTYHRATGQWRYYINGSETASGTRAYAILNTNLPLLIGCEGHSSFSPPYHWFFDGVIDDIRIYNRALFASEVAALAILPVPPTITTQPQSKTTTSGSNVTFSVSANGIPSPTFQWRLNGANIAGATGSMLTVSNAQLANAGYYTVVVSSPLGSVTSTAAELTVHSNLAPVPIALPTYTTISPPEAATDSLVVITHGRTPVGGWPNQLAWLNEMQQKLQQHLALSPNWVVKIYLWETNSRRDIAEVLRAGAVEGESMGKQIVVQAATLPGGKWSHIHLIGHSAGSAVIEKASEIIKNSFPTGSGTTIHTTFLDPYTGITDNNRALYGVHSDWSDNYFDFSTDTLDQFNGRTFGSLPHAHNVDVTALDSAKTYFATYPPSTSSTPGAPIYVPVSTHGWPYSFYTATIPTNPFPGGQGYGFPLSKEGGGWANRANYPPNNSPVSLGGTNGLNQGILPITSNGPLNVNSLAHAISSTGSVQYSGNSFTASTGGTQFAPQAAAQPRSIQGAPMSAASAPTGAPAWTSIAVELTSPVNYVSFSAQFTSALGAVGLLSVFWNDEKIGEIDECNVLSGVQNYFFEMAGSYNDRNNSLGFRIDQFSEVISTVSVTNVTTGFGGLTNPPNLKMENIPGISTPVLTLTGTQNFTYLVEASDDLLNWEPMAAVTLDTGVAAALTDSSAPGFLMRFYRAVSP